MKNIVFCIVVCISYSSCDVVTNQLEQKLNQKIELLDSTVNAEINKVIKLDSIIEKEKMKLDTILKMKEKILEQ
jgi:hypothetical protein